jgi:hypothetical protein
VVNTAHAEATAPGDVPVTSAKDTTRTQVDAVASLDLAKDGALRDTDGDGRADAGESIRYSFLVSNTGTVTVRGVTVDDPMLARAGVAVFSPQQMLVPAERMRCTATYPVRASDVPDGQSLVNVASANGRGIDSPVVSPDSMARTPVDRATVLGTRAASDGDGGSDATNGSGTNGSGTNGSGTNGDATVGGTDLPGTGGPRAPLGLTGLALLLGGLALVAWSRRHPTATPHR